MENCNSVDECIKEPTITEEETTQPSTTVDNSCGGSGETGGNTCPGVSGGCPKADPEDCTGGETSGNGSGNTSGTNTCPGTDCGGTECPDTDEDCETVCVSYIGVYPFQTQVEKGATCKLTATIRPTNATNKALEWRSEDTSIATVDGNGIVTGVKAGFTEIVAKTTDGSGLEANAVVQVTSDTSYIA